MTAVDRLALSRERLRLAMLPPPPRPAEHLFGERFGALTAGLLERLKTTPGLAELIEPIKAWWARHPLRTAGLVAADASRKLATPLAARHPLALVFGALLVGAVLVFSRSWRWIASPALVAGLLPSLASRGLRELPLASLAKFFASISAPRTAGGQAEYRDG